MTQAVEDRLTKECNDWFSKVESLLGAKPEPEDLWGEYWFDGWTPEEAIAAITSGAPGDRP